MLNEVIRLLFPITCITCNDQLRKNEQFICTSCLLDLPQTRYHLQPGNAMEKIFWGRLPIQHAFAFLQFKKGNSVQKLLHEIKYKNNRELAQFMGSYYGSILQRAEIKPDAIVPIPLHKSKLLQRGYNQSDLIAHGMAESLNAVVITNGIKRLKATETQTRKSRFARWENVDDVFEVVDKDVFVGKHILLVDDVITTGSTIEACGKALLATASCTLSVASIAVAGN
jgi:ComF family protein